eukprot:TRINITY_DN8182_c0_g1_i1.p1 TRINITY_DN8182_c0_g1~~TRINITY_DN8182_c0_g1_i1.p1  ORF type:complete len:670 (-),score=158.34 TRINITY_DN8182_c0_g1_i1:71-2080(-)
MSGREESKSEGRPTSGKRRKTKRTLTSNFSRMKMTKNKKKKSDMSINALSRKFMFLIDYVIENGSTVEGILRKSGTFQSIKTLKKEILSGKTVHLKDWDIHEIAGVLKSFLRESDEPIIWHSLCLHMINSRSVTPILKRLKVLKAILEALPPSNRLVLNRVIFMSNQIILNNETTRMDAHNIAIILAPCLLRQPKSDSNMAELIEEVNSFTEILQEMIEHYGTLFSDNEIIDINEPVDLTEDEKSVVEYSSKSYKVSKQKIRNRLQFLELQEKYSPRSINAAEEEEEEEFNLSDAESNSTGGESEEEELVLRKKNQKLMHRLEQAKLHYHETKKNLRSEMGSKLKLEEKVVEARKFKFAGDDTENTNNISAIMREIDEIETKLEEFMEKIDEQDDTIGIMQKELNVSKSELVQFENAYDELATQLSKIKSKNEEYQDILSTIPNSNEIKEAWENSGDNYFKIRYGTYNSSNGDTYINDEQIARELDVKSTLIKQLQSQLHQASLTLKTNKTKESELEIYEKVQINELKKEKKELRKSISDRRNYEDRIHELERKNSDILEKIENIKIVSNGIDYEAENQKLKEGLQEMSKRTATQVEKLQRAMAKENQACYKYQKKNKKLNNESKALKRRMELIDEAYNTNNFLLEKMITALRKDINTAFDRVLAGYEH